MLQLLVVGVVPYSSVAVEGLRKVRVVVAVLALRKVEVAFVVVVVV